MNEDAEKYLYKYFPFDIKRIKPIILKNKLYFSSPSKFNDPFDCKTLLSLKNSSYDDWFDFLKPLYKSKCTNHSDDEMIQYFNGLFKSGTLESKEVEKVLEEFINEDKEKIENLGILCLSEVRLDILMWSHYTDGHKGLCLEFGQEGIDKFRTEKNMDFEKIIYRGKYPTLIDYNKARNNKAQGKKNEFAKLCICSKSKHWKYEQEWRLISKSCNKYIEYPEEMLTGIIFGYYMSDNDKMQIKEMIKKKEHKPKLYQAKIDDDRYDINIEEIT